MSGTCRDACYWPLADFRKYAFNVAFDSDQKCGALVGR
jgi:hypothetical protein